MIETILLQGIYSDKLFAMITAVLSFYVGFIKPINSHVSTICLTRMLLLDSLALSIIGADFSVSKVMTLSPGSLFCFLFLPYILLISKKYDFLGFFLGLPNFFPRLSLSSSMSTSLSISCSSSDTVESYLGGAE